MVNPRHEAPSRHHFEIGWICALATELKASKTMLDFEYHPVTDVPAEDETLYTWGSICGHNVVMTCLTKIGCEESSRAATNMTRTHKKLRFLLMVGVGGGVPGCDIKLGDVVISEPKDGHPGVVQYDYGKAVSDGRYELTGSLNRPSDQAIGAMRQYQTTDMPLETLVATIERALKGSAGIREQFSRPKSGLNHPHGQEGPRTEAQPKGVPQIHCGLIASGNSVIKDETERDRIRANICQKLPHRAKILCFEMEAAGLMNNYPSLVIRGICDYCDGKKDKIWQPYAALVAAAYAKELLLQIPPRVYTEPQSDQSPYIGPREALSEDEDDMDFKSNPPRFEFEPRVSSEETPSNSTTRRRSTIVSMNHSADSKARLTHHGISMTALKWPLPKTQLPLRSQTNGQEQSLTVPIFEINDVNIKDVIQEWSRTFPHSSNKAVKFQNDNSAEIYGEIASRQELVPPRFEYLPVKVIFRVVRAHEDRSWKSLKQILKDDSRQHEIPFAIISFNLGENPDAIRKGFFKWRESIRNLNGWSPSFIILGLSDGTSDVRPRDRNDPTYGCVLSEAHCLEVSREGKSSIYIEISREISNGRDAALTTLIGYTAAAIFDTGLLS